MPPLLGKSLVYDRATGTRRIGRGYVLMDHIRETLDMARFLMDDVPFGRLLHKAMALTVPYDQLRQVVMVATLAHDLGKAGTDFQQFIRSVDSGKRPWKWQRYRHEHLTAWLLVHHPEIRDWLLDAVGGDDHLADLVVAAAFGHHMKTQRLPDPDEEGTTAVKLRALSQALNRLSREYDIEPFPHVDIVVVDVEDLRDDVMDLLYAGGKEDGVAQAAKWIVAIADTLGSFNPADHTKYKSPAAYRKALYDRIRSLFRPKTHDFMARVPQVALDNPRDVQWKAMEMQGQSGMLVAPCGDGKTIAALLWANENKNLIFTTPTTGTATQIYLDHVKAHPDVLIHSRSRVDHALFATPEGDAKATDDEQVEWDEAIHQFFDFGRPISYTTVDQVAGLLVNSRKSILWLLHLVTSQVVFDEFDAYGPRLAAYHLWFVETFPGIPTLHMSATGTTSHRDALKKARPDLQYRRGIGAQENVPRYILHILDSIDDLAEALTAHEDDHSEVLVGLRGSLTSDRPTPRGDDDNRVREAQRLAALSRPTKTLWICNRVREAQRLARLHPDALCYHSRYRYQDRRKIHNAFVDMFREGLTPEGDGHGIATQVADISRSPDRLLSMRVHGIATQVAEISLDISSTRLISEIAPVHALIQRLGRLNRDFVGEPCHAYFYLPKKKAPYLDHFDPEAIADWLKCFEGRAISQRELVETFEYTRYAHLFCRQLARRPLMQTVRMPLREAINVRALWDADFAEHGRELLRDPIQLSALEIPLVLSKKQREGLPKRGHHYLIPSYDLRLGVAA